MKLRSLIPAIFAATGVLLSASVNASADDQWRGVFNFDPVQVNFKGGTANFNIGLSAYRQVHEKVSLGFGLQLLEPWNFKIAPSFPLYAGIHYENFGERFTPTFDFNTGISLSSENFDYSAFFINPMIGFRYGKFGAGIGYHGSIPVGVKGAEWGSGINLRLAYFFSYGGSIPESIKRPFQHPTVGLELTYDIPSETEKYYGKTAFSFGANAYMLFHLSDDFELGPMAGIHYMGRKYLDANDSWEWIGTFNTFWFPIALRGRYNLNSVKIAGKIHPWAQLDLGGVAAVSVDGADENEYAGSFYWCPAIGLSYEIRGGESSIDLGFGYHTLRPYINDGRKEEGTYTTNIFRISLGYNF